MIEMVETVNLKQMQDIRTMLNKKLASYFGDGDKDTKNVGYMCLLKQVAIIEKTLTENNISLEKVEVKVEDVPVKAKRKYVKKTTREATWGGYDGYGYKSYGSF